MSRWTATSLFVVFVLATSGCCSTPPIVAIKAPPKPVLFDYTEEELAQAPTSLLEKIERDGREYDRYVDKVNARFAAINGVR